MGRFADADAVFLRRPPLAREALSAVDAPHVCVVPLFAARGYITGELIPGEMGLAGPRTVIGGKTVHLAEPIGGHPLLVETVSGRIRDIAAAHGLDPARTGVFVVGHGTPRAREAASEVAGFADGLRGKVWAGEVAAAFLELAPRAEDWADRIRAPEVIVIPYLFAGGPHGMIDLPRRLGLAPEDIQAELAGGPVAGPFPVKGRRLWYCQPLSLEPVLAEVVIDRVARAVTG